MIATITNGISNAAGRVAQAILPQDGEQVGIRTRAVAVAAIAVTATYDPMLAAQLGTTYLVGTVLWNRGARQDQQAFQLRAQQVPVQPPQGRVQARPQQHIHEEKKAERLIEEPAYVHSQNEQAQISMILDNGQLLTEDKIAFLKSTNIHPEVIRTAILFNSHLEDTESRVLLAAFPEIY